MQKRYLGQVVKPLLSLPKAVTHKIVNTLAFDELRKRVKALEGRFYCQEDVVFALCWLDSGQGVADLERLIEDAEKRLEA